MQTFKEFILESSDMEQMFIDMIETEIQNKNHARVEQLKNKFFEKFGREFAPEHAKTHEVSLDRIYSQQDFKNYHEYAKYAFDLFALRFHKYKSKLRDPHNTTVSPDEMIQFYKNLDCKVAFGNGGRENARVEGKNLIRWSNKFENSSIPTDTIIHELGHVLDNQSGLPSAHSNLFDLNNATSNYMLNPSEVFADAFRNFCISSAYIKSGWPDIYDFFKYKIPSKWKNEIKKLIG